MEYLLLGFLLILIIFASTELFQNLTQKIMDKINAKYFYSESIAYDKNQPEKTRRKHKWIARVIMIAICIPIITFLGYVYYRKVSNSGLIS